jgi:hypothetical protein
MTKLKICYNIKQVFNLGLVINIKVGEIRMNLVGKNYINKLFAI